MKTAIYIDGYNFYYSRLKDTPYKWLDIVILFRDLIAWPQQPEADVVSVKFFTAPAKPVMRDTVRFLSKPKPITTGPYKPSTLIWSTSSKGFMCLNPPPCPPFRQAYRPTKKTITASG